MKKISVLLIIISFTFLFSGCLHSEFINPAIFIERYNIISPLDFTDFYSKTENRETTYYSYIKNNNKTVLLSLITDESGSIKECRVTLPKTDLNSKKSSIENSAVNLFFNVCANTDSSYTYKSFEESINFISSFDFEKNINLENFEKTKEEGSFYYIFLSNQVCCEFIIKNKWINEIETTLKPENKKDFADNTSIRTETVPLS